VPAALWAAERPRAVSAPAVVAAAPAALAAPLAADVLLAEQREVQIARDSAGAEPAAVAPLCVAAALAISALAVVENDAPALAASEFAAARAAIEPVAAQPPVVAAVTELFVVWQLLSAPAVADASFVGRPADEPVGPPVGPLPEQLHLVRFAGQTAVSATLAFAVARCDRHAQPVSPDQPFVVHVLALLQGLAAEPFARLYADPKFGVSDSSPGHSTARLSSPAPDLP